MEYAIQMLLPIVGGLLLGVWLTENYGVSPIWTVVLAILGMVGGIGILYKRFTYPELYPNSKKSSKDEVPASPSHRPSTAEPSKPSTTKASSAKESAKSLPIDQLSFLYEEPDHDRNREEFDINLDDHPDTDKPEKELP
jgi:hypothetical protein